MPATDKISIIIPVYNAAQYLPQTIESLLSQTYRNIELILVDDGSTDDSLDVCRKYEVDPRVLVVHQANGGRSNARNTGISHASGDFIGFMDDDDVAHPRMFESLHSAITDTGSDISMCQMIYGRTGGINFNKIDKAPQVEQIGRTEFYRRFFGPSNHTFEYRVIWNKLYHRTQDTDFSFRSDIHGEDIDFLIRYRSRIAKVAYIDTPLIYYRVHADSLSHSSSSTGKIIDDNINFLKLFSPDDEITPLFIQKAWMEAFAVRHNSRNTDEEKKVRQLYQEWRIACKKSRLVSTLALGKRIFIKLVDYCPVLYILYLKLR